MEVDAGGESRSSESGAFPMPHTRLIGHQGTVYSVCFAPAKFLLSAGDDATVRLWSLETSLNVMVYKGHTFPVWDVCFSPVGSYFASASLDRTARIWVTDKASPLRILAGHHADVERCRFHPNGNYLATCSSDKSMRLWDVASGECVRIFLGHAAAVVSLVMSPSGLTAATGGASFTAFKYHFAGVLFFTDCLSSICADSDGRVIIWDLNSGKSLKVCSSQTKTKQSNAAGAQADDQGWIARYLAAGATAESPAHTQSVTALSFSADGAVLASGSLDCSIKLWSWYTTYSTPLPPKYHIFNWFLCVFWQCDGTSGHIDDIAANQIDADSISEFHAAQPAAGVGSVHQVIHTSKNSDLYYFFKLPPRVTSESLGNGVCG
jgi:transcription initiation factor TFIID subunit 5